IVYILSARDRTSIAMLVVNLAVADIIHAGNQMITRDWIFNEFGCKFAITIDILCTVVIVYTVAALSVERYIDAKLSLTVNNKFRTIITITCILLIWTLGLLMPLPYIIHTYLHRSTNNNTGHRSCDSKLTEKFLLIHEIILYIFAFVIPYSIIVIFSLKLLKFLREWLKRKQKLTRASITRKRTRGVKLVLCIVLSFLICYSPFWIFKFLTRFLIDETVQRRPLLTRILQYTHQFVIVVNHFEGILNPLFFIVLTERFCLTFSQHRRKRFQNGNKDKNNINQSYADRMQSYGVNSIMNKGGGANMKSTLQQRNGNTRPVAHFIKQEEENDKHILLASATSMNTEQTLSTTPRSTLVGYSTSLNT
ncbi:unnamed protein product, partial [Didymodactylos carnosus]